jgi:asparagine synthase (glutamine-hydrolysing)
MCGIAGHLAFPRADAAAVRRMAAALVHRGPDGEGFLDDGPISLGHRRLSIIDVKGGAQPIFNEDGSVAVILNGEIYNYRELREELRARHSFRTQSDTEVLVHLYEEEGEAMLGRLRGMFALALWDRRRERLLLARDPLGEKPLYYCESRAGLHFASDLRALRQGGAPLGALDRDALSDYLELLYIPAPRTICAGARKLAAGHYLVCDARGSELRRYYAPPAPGSAEGLAPTATQLRAQLAEAVSLRLRSDVPIAALLSGGIDSSAVVALMAQELGPGVRTFAVGFGEADDELPYARAVAAKFRTEHRELILRDDVAAQTAEALAAYGEPFGDSSAVPAVAVCKAVAREAKVVLTGDGGDELFAGYGRYRTVAYLPRVPLASHGAALLDRLPLPRRAALRRLALAFGSSGAARYRALVEVFSRGERAALLGGLSRVADAPEAASDVDAALAFDLNTYLPDDLLAKADGASMRWGLEWRSPLVDRKLAAMVVPQPAATKLSRQDSKLLLKAAMRDLLPPEILTRKKRGFGSPVAQWLRGPLREQVGDLLRAPSARPSRCARTRALDRALTAALGAGGNAHQAWALFVLEVHLRGAAA